MLKYLRMARPLVIGFLLVVLCAVALGAQAQASIAGPDLLSDQQVGTYKVTNPNSSQLDIFSSSGIWIRGITADEGVMCDLKDEGTLDTIACTGSFTVAVSSDYGQQLRFVLGDQIKLVSVAGVHPEQDQSQVHIYNGDGSGQQVQLLADAKLPVTVTNVLEGRVASYELTALNVTEAVTRTFDITLFVPQGAVLESAPPSCAAQKTHAGYYTCSYVVGPHVWYSEKFEVRWVKAGVHTMWAHAFVGSKDVGQNERVGNVLRVLFLLPRQFIPVTQK